MLGLGMGLELRCGRCLERRKVVEIGLSSLITPSCTHRGYRVYLGKHALGRVEAGEQVREVVRSIPHPQYQISPTHLNHDHDIMLLELQSPVQLTSHIRVLPLSHNDCLPAGTCCRVSGWGTTTSPQGRQPHRWHEGSVGQKWEGRLEEDSFININNNRYTVICYISHICVIYIYLYI